jgi:hypothetical protein
MSFFEQDEKKKGRDATSTGMDLLILGLVGVGAYLVYKWWTGQQGGGGAPPAGGGGLGTFNTPSGLTLNLNVGGGGNLLGGGGGGSGPGVGTPGGAGAGNAFITPVADVFNQTALKGPNVAPLPGGTFAIRYPTLAGTAYQALPANLGSGPVTKDVAGSIAAQKASAASPYRLIAHFFPPAK